MRSNGETTQNISGLAAGEYIITVSDNANPLNGLSPGTYICEVTDTNNAYCTDTFTLLNPIIITFEKTDATYYDASDGTVDVSVIGGEGPYKYRWSNKARFEDLNGLTAGDYPLVITDAALQQDSIIVTIGQPEILYKEITFPSLGRRFSWCRWFDFKNGR